MITLAQGGGGEEMDALIADIFSILDDDILYEANDAAVLPPIKEKVVMSTDSFVLDPLFIKGADIGKLAVCGSINDVAMMGATPLYLSLAFILEEGLKSEDLKKILFSIKETAKHSGVRVVCGDTKVVPKGKGGGVFINTTCVGKASCPLDIKNIEEGCVLIASRDLGAHGACVMAKRNELESELKSDCKALIKEVNALKNLDVKTMRDATRGGLAALLNEWASFTKYELLVYEENIPVSDEVLGLCELYGFEPTHLACEGTFIACVGKNDAKKALEILKGFNENASIIGEVLARGKARVVMKSTFGGLRVMERPKGELLPRIC